jgi:hypothetical protein
MAAPKKKTPTAKDPKKPEPSADEPDEPDEPDDDALNERINAIVTSHTKRLQKTLSKQFDEIRALLAKPEPAADETETDETEADETEAKPAKDAASRRLEKRVAAAEKRAAAAEEREKKQAEQARAAEERSTIGAALTKAGITNPTLHEAALSLLANKGMIARDDAGLVRIKGKDKYQLEELLDVDTGVAQWLKTDGKAFLPPTDAGGSGASPSTGAGSETMTRSDYAKLDKREQAMIELDRASRGLPPLAS